MSHPSRVRGLKPTGARFERKAPSDGVGREAGEAMKYFSTFTGVFGFDMGLPDDWQCVGVSEIDKNACKVIKYRKPDVKNYGDIEKIRIEELPNFDILVGGSPC